MEAQRNVSPQRFREAEEQPLRVPGPGSSRLGPGSARRAVLPFSCLACQPVSCPRSFEGQTALFRFSLSLSVQAVGVSAHATDSRTTLVVGLPATSLAKRR